MDKNAIKRFAVWARRELISRVSQKALQYGISDKEIVSADAGSIDGTVLSDTEKKQRKALVEQINKKGYEQVMEEVAYTWFNRFVAIRYMEVNGYLPSKVRVFTDENGAFKPQILAEAINLELEGLDMEKVYALKDANDDETLYKYLFVTQCNALNANLPYMFAKIENYTELLLPDYLLRDGSVIEQMVSQISEEDWTDQVQIIGWLYQYYNTEKKDEVFAALKKNVKITKENIPAATQLFTPDWIVRYMVENSLGRLWTEGHPDADIKTNWKYYLEEAEQEPEVEAELAKIRAEYAKLTPEEIKVIDPCMGSGHILVYAFEVLMQIYESAGYTQRDAAELIVEKNLYGLDIDDRAGQLAYFDVMMMARKYNRRILNKGITPNVMAIQDSSNMNVNTITFIANGNDKIKNDLLKIKTVLADAKEYGSILNVPEVDFEAIYAAIEACQDREGDLLAEIEKKNAVSEVLPMVKQAQVMAQKYDVCVTNPPYMGGSGMSAKLSEFVKDNYPDSKSDLFACFIEKCPAMLNKNGMYAMITQHAFMFLSSYEKLREKMQMKTTINMAHLGARAFDEIGGEVVQTTAFVSRNHYTKDYQGLYARLVDVNGEAEKEKLFLSGEKRHTAKQENFSKISGMPVAYWVSQNIMRAFAENDLIGDVATPKQGSTLGDNATFLRFWFEIAEMKTKWHYCMKGGEFRRWYGNLYHVLDWEDNGSRVKATGRATIRSESLLFNEGITWSNITSGLSSFRYMPEGFFFESTGSVCFIEKDKLFYLLGFLNTPICQSINNAINPTLHLQSGDIAKLPLKVKNESIPIINSLVEDNINLCKTDWDSFEISWDFKCHPLVEFRFAGTHTWGDNPSTMSLQSAFKA